MCFILDVNSKRLIADKDILCYKIFYPHWDKSLLFNRNKYYSGVRDHEYELINNRIFYAQDKTGDKVRELKVIVESGHPSGIFWSSLESSSINEGIHSYSEPKIKPADSIILSKSIFLKEVDDSIILNS